MDALFQLLDRMSEVAKVFNVATGLLDNALETSVSGSRKTKALKTSERPISLQQAVAQGIPLIELSRQNIASLSTLSISADAKAYYHDSNRHGTIVLVPNKPVPIGNTSTISWLEYNPTTGEVAGVFDNGIRSAISEEGEAEAEDAVLIATLDVELTVPGGS